MGDYNNFLRGTARKYLLGYTADNESFEQVSRMVRTNVETFYRQWIKPIQGKIIGFMEGNHHFRFEDGTTCTQYLCQLSGVPYLEHLAGIRLVVESGATAKRPGNRRALIIMAHHGDWAGGYSRPGGDLNAIENRSWPWECDIALFAHSHRKLAYHSPIMQLPKVGALRVVERPKILIRTGSFVRGFLDGHTGRYPEKKLLPPNELGYVRLQIKFYTEYQPEKYQAAKTAGKLNARGLGNSEPRYRFEARI